MRPCMQFGRLHLAYLARGFWVHGHVVQDTEQRLAQLGVPGGQLTQDLAKRVDRHEVQACPLWHRTQVTVSRPQRVPNGKPHQSGRQMELSRGTSALVTLRRVARESKSAARRLYGRSYSSSIRNNKSNVSAASPAGKGLWITQRTAIGDQTRFKKQCG